MYKLIFYVINLILTGHGIIKERHKYTCIEIELDNLVVPSKDNRDDNFFQQICSYANGECFLCTIIYKYTHSCDIYMYIWISGMDVTKLEMVTKMKMSCTIIQTISNYWTAEVNFTK